MKWKLSGAYRATGQDIEILVDANDRQQVYNIALERGIYLSSCEAILEPSLTSTPTESIGSAVESPRPWVKRSLIAASVIVIASQSAWGGYRVGFQRRGQLDLNVDSALTSLKQSMPGIAKFDSSKFIADQEKQQEHMDAHREKVQQDMADIVFYCSSELRPSTMIPLLANLNVGGQMMQEYRLPVTDDTGTESIQRFTGELLDKAYLEVKVRCGSGQHCRIVLHRADWRVYRLEYGVVLMHRLIEEVGGAIASTITPFVSLRFLLKEFEGETVTGPLGELRDRLAARAAYEATEDTESSET